MKVKTTTVTVYKDKAWADFISCSGV